MYYLELLKMKFYHGTNAENHQAILEEGLKGGKSWKEGQGVYLTPLPQYANNYGDILEINLPDEFLEKHDHHQGWDINEFIIIYGQQDQVIIPAEFISNPCCDSCGDEIDGYLVLASPEFRQTLQYNGKIECQSCYEQE